MTDRLPGSELGSIFSISVPLAPEPTAYCWVREKTGALAEVDYQLACGNHAVPIEVNAGFSTGEIASRVLEREEYEST